MCPKFLYWSDLHTEHDAEYDCPFQIPDLTGRGIDAIILGGDTAIGAGHLDFCERLWDALGITVITIRGNHEYWDELMEEVDAHDHARSAALQAAGKDIRLLDGTSTMIGDITVVGATLWTDYKVQDFHQELAMFRSKQWFPDYKWIGTGPMGKRITPKRLLARHNHDLAGIVECLKSSDPKKVIVVSHHMPNPDVIDERFKSADNACFCSDLRPLIHEYTPAWWIYGHSHSGLDLDVQTATGTTRIRTNPRAYPFEGRRRAFNPYAVIDTDLQHS
jgi:predicted phosphohydrolase